MLIELPKQSYHLVHHIRGVNLFPLIASVAYHVQDGKIFVDDIETPNIVFISHKSSFSFLHVEKEIADYEPYFNFIYSNADVPQYFHLYDPPQFIISALEAYSKVNIRIRDRVRMEGSYDSISDKSINLDEQYGIKSIQQLTVNDLEHFSHALISSFYKSLEDFIQNSIGWAITHNDKAVAMWYTLTVVNNNCDGDIWTFPEYRGLGFATIMGKKILESYKERGIRQDWDVFLDNHASAKIGKNFNYKPYHYYKFVSVYKLL